MRLRATTAGAEMLIPLLERKRLIDSAWIVSLVGGLGPVAGLWFLSILEIDLERAAWAVLLYAVVYLCAATLSDRLSSPSAVAAAIHGTTVASVVFLGALWHLVGGLDNPMFLLMFTLPVLTSGIMMVRWLATVTALASIVTVFAVAMWESPDLRWYFARFHLTAPALTAFLSEQSSTRAFRGLEMGPAYEFTLIVMFAFMQCVVAFVSTPLTLLLQRINGRFETSGKMLAEVQGIFHAVLRASPDPTVIVYADSGQVVQASDSFFQRMLVRPSQLIGKGVLEIVEFVDPARVKRGFEAPAGEIPFCVYRVQGETRIASLTFYRTEHAGTAYMYLGWHELTELYYLESAFDAVEDPLVVVSADGRLRYANQTAKQLFGPLHFGLETSSVPALRSVMTCAAAPGAADERERRAEIGGVPYAVSALVAPLPEESETCTILWLHCVAKEEALFQQAVRDPLTGIYNRRYFDDALGQQIERSKRGQKVALAYFDLDKFKAINDTLGHAAGDAALVTFVTAVQTELRDTDIFARRGGDEFAVIFVDCDIDVAAAAIERLRAWLIANGGRYEGTRFEVGFSAGLAACHPEDGVEDLLDRADRAVYTAKESGRGRLVVER